MKYYEIKFTISPYSSDASDMVAALAGEAGFETFEETEDGLKGYVQQSLFSEEALQEALTDFPFEGVSVAYDIREAEDRDWNEQWEQEGFEPIAINDRLVIHDGRHLPEGEFPVAIEIDAKLAFGTGTHETTRMICATLLDTDLHDKRILDCGTGTGILSICGLKLGAREAIGYDIDEWSVDNARHNAVINRVDERFQSLLGDATILNKVEGSFDIVLANINRNILLADLPQFRMKMAPEARLILSGFYMADCPVLIKKASILGLRLLSQKEDHDWACLIFTTES
jgi:ribosomal protein L11 methyltransferase